MIGYVTLGTNDLARAARFYDALLGEIGAKRAMEMESFIAWAVAPNTPMVSVIKPFDGKAATVGNGVMVALMVDSKAKVEALHKKALALGGKGRRRARPARRRLLRRVLPRSRRQQAERVLPRLSGNATGFDRRIDVRRSISSSAAMPGP